MKAKKVLALVLCAALLVAGSVAATLAYLTSKTEVVTNTFSVGDVKITLDEAKVTEYGVKDGDSRVMKNTYKLIPGHNYLKDPTIHVKKGSEECWLFVRVENGIADYEAVGNTTIAAQMAAKGWTEVAGKTGVYAYNAKVSAGANVEVFASFTVAGNAVLTNADGSAKYSANTPITVQAYAVQADNFGNAAAAYAAAPCTAW